MAARGSRFESHAGAPMFGRGRGVHAHVGAVAYHGIADRDTAGQQINTQLRTLVSVVLTTMGADPALAPERDQVLEMMKMPNWIAKVDDSKDAIAKAPPAYQSLWFDAVEPLWREWNDFYHARQHWYDAFTEQFTSWETYLEWIKRVEDLRKKVEAAGIKIALPAIGELHKSVQEKAEETAADMWKFVKWGGIAALGIAGVATVALAVKTVRR